MQSNKNEQLGMNFGTASGRLRKEVLYSLAVKLNLHRCFQCGFLIEDSREFSIEHKQPWLNSDSPRELFFSLDNIAFSHLKCNVDARRPPKKYKTEEERRDAERKLDTVAQRKRYTPERRRKKYLEKGY